MVLELFSLLLWLYFIALWDSAAAQCFSHSILCGLIFMSETRMTISALKPPSCGCSQSPCCCGNPLTLKWVVKSELPPSGRDISWCYTYPVLSTKWSRIFSEFFPAGCTIEGSHLGHQQPTSLNL